MEVVFYEGLYINQKGKGTNLLIIGLLLKEIWRQHLIWNQWLNEEDMYES
jgi:hypothetical protein